MTIPPVQPELKSLLCDNLLGCILNLSALDMAVYELIARHGPLDTNEVARKIDKDRSSVYRCLKRLIGCGICYRKKENLADGGHIYIYHASYHRERCGRIFSIA